MSQHDVSCDSIWKYGIKKRLEQIRFRIEKLHFNSILLVYFHEINAKLIYILSTFDYMHFTRTIFWFPFFCFSNVH